MKQETLEEAAEKWLKSKTLLKSSQAPGLLIGFIDGAKWQTEKSHSNEEVLMILQEFKRYLSFGDEVSESEWFEQFKKK
jgi:hypothetical protein